MSWTAVAMRGAKLGGNVGADRGDEVTIFDEIGVERVDFGAGAVLAEQGIAGTEGAVEAAKGAQVGGVELAAEEVEGAAAAGGGSADDVEVVVGEPSDAGGLEVCRGAGLVDGVEAEGALRRFVAKLQVGVRDLGGEAEAGLSGPDALGEGICAGGLEAGGGADGFKDRGLALGVGSDNEIRAGGWLEGEALEAPEVGEADRGELRGLAQGNSLIRVCPGGGRVRRGSRRVGSW